MESEAFTVEDWIKFLREYCDNSRGTLEQVLSNSKSTIGGRIFGGIRRIAWCPNCGSLSIESAWEETLAEKDYLHYCIANFPISYCTNYPDSPVRIYWGDWKLAPSNFVSALKTVGSGGDLSDSRCTCDILMLCRIGCTCGGK